MKPTVDINSIANQFPCLSEPVNGKRLAWLDTASTALKPNCVVTAIQDYYLRFPANVHRGVHTLSASATSHFEESRRTVQTFINAASPDEIVFTSGTTDSINMVAMATGQQWLKEGDEVLVTELEHHANIVPWQLLRDRIGIKLRVVPIDKNGDISVDAFKRELTSRTRLVAFTAVSNAIGTQLPIGEFTHLAHEAGAKVLIDAAQAAACIALDVQVIDCDFLVFSGHKLFGPTGIGVLYGKAQHLAQLPPVKGGGDMIRSVTFEHTSYNELPYKFEAGTANIAGAIGLGRAINFIKDIGFDAIMQHESALVELALEELQHIKGVSIIGTPRHRRNIISFAIEGVHPHDAGTLLDEDGVAVRAGHHCAQPLLQRLGVPATIRASFSLYNNRQDVEQLVTSINRIIGIFS